MYTDALCNHDNNFFRSCVAKESMEVHIKPSCKFKTAHSKLGFILLTVSVVHERIR